MVNLSSEKCYPPFEQPRPGGARSLPHNRGLGSQSATKCWACFDGGILSTEGTLTLILIRAQILVPKPYFKRQMGVESPHSKELLKMSNFIIIIIIIVIATLFTQFNEKGRIPEVILIEGIHPKPDVHVID